MSGEVWRSVPGAPRYEVSNQGRIRSVVSGQFLKPTRDSQGYARVSTPPAPGCKLHIIVLLAFVGERPDGQVTRHLNGDSFDNRLSNLAYGTPSENTQDALRHGTHNNARKTECAQGHEYTAENTYVGSGGRKCRTCDAATHLRRREALKAAGVPPPRRTLSPEQRERRVRLARERRQANRVEALVMDDLAGDETVLLGPA